jgi:hypothetical protein
VFCGTVSCKVCGDKITEDTDSRIGLACKRVVGCDNCGSKRSFSTYNKRKEGLFERNVGLFHGLQPIGKGHAASQMLHAVPNLRKLAAKFSKYTNIV